jgi:hypothetical protein
MPAATAPVAAPAAISTATSQILRTRSAKPMAVLLLIGRRAARDFAAVTFLNGREGDISIGWTQNREIESVEGANLA